jgi:hypothetical protein
LRALATQDDAVVAGLRPFESLSGDKMPRADVVFRYSPDEARSLREYGVLGPPPGGDGDGDVVAVYEHVTWVPPAAGEGEVLGDDDDFIDGL